MKHSNSSRTPSGVRALFCLIVLMAWLTAGCGQSSSKKERSDSSSSFSAFEFYYSGYSHSDDRSNSSQSIAESSGQSIAESSSDSPSLSELREEAQRRLDELSGQEQEAGNSSTSASAESTASSESSESSYPDDPYHVYEYDDPDYFWDDWGGEFNTYDDCYEYWENAWGNLEK